MAVRIGVAVVRGRLSLPSPLVPRPSPLLVRPHDRCLFVDAAQVVLRDAAVDHDAVFLVALRENFAMRGQISLQPAIFHARFDIDVAEIVAQCGTDFAGQLQQTGSAASADRQCIRITA